MTQPDDSWIETWLDAVANGSATMSQRRLSSVERHGGTSAAVAAATKRGVHLAKVIDDQGIVLIAASLHPFEALC